MKLEKILYVVLSSFVIITFVLFNFIFSPLSSNKENESGAKQIFLADNISSALRKVIDNFNTKFKGQIEVKTIDLPFEKFSTNERKELLARYLRNKSERIDIFAVDHIWVPRFAKWGKPLDQYFSLEEKNELLSYAFNTCKYDNKLIAIPLYIDIALMYYRDDLLAQLPNYKQNKKLLESSITWEDFIKIGNSFKNKKNYYSFEADDYEGLICAFLELVESNNAEILKNGKIELTKPEIEKSLQLLVDIVNKYQISPPEVVTYKETQAYNNFINKNGLFLRGWPGFEHGELTRMTKNKNIIENVKKIPVPHFGGNKQASIFGGWNLMISKFSDKTSESITFIKYLMSEESQKILFEEGGYLPIINKLYYDENYVNVNPDLKFYFDLFKTGVNRPAFENYSYISDIISYYANLAIKNQISVDEALSKAEDIINSKNILIK